MPKSTLPPKPSLEKLKKQAKALLKAHRSGDVGACEALRLVHRFRRLPDQEILRSPVTLNDTQFALALSYGFGDWDELRTHVESVLSVQQAGELMLKGEYARAKEYAEEAIDLTPNRAEPYTRLGQIHIWGWISAEHPKPRKKLDLAQECARKALSISADHAVAHNVMAAVYVHKGQTAEAIAESKKAVSLSPNTADLHADMAGIYRGSRMPEKALPAIMKARQLDPTQDRYLELLGKVYADLGRHEESYAALGEAAESRGRDSGEARKVADIPDLDRQRESFTRFLQMDTQPQDRQDTGLQKVLKSVFPIGNPTRDLSLEYVSYRLAEPEHSVEECARRGVTYEAPILVAVRLVFFDVDKVSGTQDTRDIREQEIHIGAIPLMINSGAFIVDGRERAVLSNHNRSSGVFFGHDKGKTNSTGEAVCRSRILPVRGSWLEMEVDHEGIVYGRIDRRRRFPITMLLKALGYTAESILNGLTYVDGVSNGDSIHRTLNIDKTDNGREALIEIYRLLRPELPATLEVAEDFVNHLFLKPSYYDLSSIGRLRINHCLGIDTPISLRFLRKEDVLLTVKALVRLSDKQVPVDGIGHLDSVGELLQHLYRVGLMRMARECKECMGLQQVDALMPADLVNPEPISAAVEEFFSGI